MIGWDEYDAAKHLLTAPFIADRTAPFIKERDFEWIPLFERSLDWSSTEQMFVQAAFDLWSGGRELVGRRNVRLDDPIRRLDSRNFGRLTEALLIREGLIQDAEQLERVRSLLAELAHQRDPDDEFSRV